MRRISMRLGAGRRRSWLYERVGEWVERLSRRGRRLQPVFVLGTGRCGTWLLLDILRSGRNVNIFPTEALEIFHPDLYPYAERKIESPPFWQDPAEFTRISVGHWPEGYHQRLRHIFMGQQFIGGEEKPFVVKTTMVSHMIPELLDIFDEPRFVHMYRHGIPFMNSFVRKEWPKYQRGCTLEEFKKGAATYWNECIKEIEENKNKLLGPDQILEIGYEDFCSDTGGNVEAIRRFLGCRDAVFDYDYETVKDKNVESGDLHAEEYAPYIDLMREGLKLKGYL